MPGVSSNIDAKIKHEYKKNKLPLPGDNNDSALAQVMHLLIREKLTGRKNPPDINEILNIWRPWITSRIGNSLNELSSIIGDQKAFAQEIQKVINNLEDTLSDSNSSEDEDNDNNDDNNENDEEKENQQSALGEESSERSGEEEEDSEQGDSEGVDESDDGEFGETDSEMPGNPSTFKPTNEQENQISYKIFTTQFDEVVSAQELCDFEELKR